jgi:dTDP-glucose 4,6-dehydratase
MKILIYGGKGWIGSQFVKILDKLNLTYFVSENRVDGDIEREILCLQPTHIISFIGRTHGGNFTTIDYLEQKGKIKENVRDNLYCPLKLAILCNESDIHFTYLGTGCIFSYDEDHTELEGFLEEDEPNFFGSSYSTVKGYTDRLMHLLEKNVLNLRIRMPITDEPNGRNFITKITTYEKICSISNSMTILPELLPLIPKLMEMKQTGTLNFTNPGTITHNEILEMFQEIVDNNFTWENFSIEEQDKILSSQRSNNYLETKKLQELFPNVSHIKEGVRKCLQNYKNTYIPLKKKQVSSIKNLLVTGGCGFIGSNFINHIIVNFPNINIINIDAMYYCASEDNIKYKDSKNYKFIKGNICSKDLIHHVLHNYSIDCIIHFAAQSHVQNSFEDSILYTNDNVLGTHTLLEETRKYGKVKKFIHVSTDEVYGESQKNENKKTENTVLCPTNPYAATKAAAELIVQSYYHSFKLPIIITRGNNVFGPNQYPEKVIPLFIKQLQNNEKVTIQGNGESLRSFLHVDDTVQAFEKILFQGEIGEIYNIGSEYEISIKQLANTLIHLIKPNSENTEDYISYIEDRPFNDYRYYVCSEKIKKLGWKQNVQFVDGLKKLLG